MAGSSLLALLDDIATLLDDISVMTKVAAKKTAGVLGDDLAVNAERVTGVRAERELPVVWAVAKGSAVNKLILVPAALLISAVLPWAVTPLLMLGGAYLCYEGFEKLWHFFTHRGAEAVEAHEELLEAAADPAVDLVEYEKAKIKGAIRTDFILSAEIIVIALGTVQGQDLVTRIGVLSAIAVLMTIGVYGLVAGIVKLDEGPSVSAQILGADPAHPEQLAIGAAVIGGTSLFGGKGRVAGTLLGVFFIALVGNSLNMLGLRYWHVIMVKGAVILLAAFLDAVRSRFLVSTWRRA